jgi:hypothetical protein
MQRDLKELVAANVISQEVADMIQDYYGNKKGLSANRLFVVFGILSGILIVLHYNLANLAA